MEIKKHLENVKPLKRDKGILSELLTDRFILISYQIKSNIIYELILYRNPCMLPAWGAKYLMGYATVIQPKTVNIIGFYVLYFFSCMTHLM